MKKQFWFLPLEWQNFYIGKDVCQVPLQIQEKFGYETSLIFIGKNFSDENPYSNYKGMKIIILDSYFRMIFFLIKNIFNIELFGTFHFHMKSLFILLIYRLLNWKGKIILKSDISYGSTLQLIGFTKKKIKKIIINLILNIIDVFTVESRKNMGLLKETFYKHSDKFVLVGNGFNSDDVVTFNPDLKENNIVVIGIIGDENKNHNLLIQVLDQINFNQKWNLYFVGKIINNFDKNNINKNYNNLDIKFTGPIYEKKYLYELLNKSKIFCHTSNYEGDPLVQYESMYYGLFCVSTDCGTIKEKYPHFYSKISLPGDIANYRENLQEVLHNIENNYYGVQDYYMCHDYCSNNYLWKNTILNLINKLM